MTPTLALRTWSVRSDIDDIHPPEDHHLVTGQNKLILRRMILRGVRPCLFVARNDIWPEQNLANRTLGLKESRPAPTDRARCVNRMSD